MPLPDPHAVPSTKRSNASKRSRRRPGPVSRTATERLQEHSSAKMPGMAIKWKVMGSSIDEAATGDKACPNPAAAR